MLKDTRCLTRRIIAARIDRQESERYNPRDASASTVLAHGGDDRIDALDPVPYGDFRHAGSR